MKLNFTSLVCGGAAIFYNFLVALPAHAVDITWYLTSNVDFPGGSATGYFTYDTNTGLPVQADITLNEGSSQIVFTSGDFGTTFTSYNTAASTSSSFNQLALCSNPNGSSCPNGSTVLVLSTTNDFTSTTSGAENFSTTGANPSRNSYYYTLGSSNSPVYATSGGVYQIPFNLPGGEGSVLLGGVLAIGAVRRLKNYSSSTKIANPTGSKLVD